MIRAHEFVALHSEVAYIGWCVFCRDVCIRHESSSNLCLCGDGPLSIVLGLMETISHRVSNGRMATQESVTRCRDSITKSSTIIFHDIEESIDVYKSDLSPLTERFFSFVEQKTKNANKTHIQRAIETKKLAERMKGAQIKFQRDGKPARPNKNAADVTLRVDQDEEKVVRTSLKLCQEAPAHKKAEIAQKSLSKLRKQKRDHARSVKSVRMESQMDKKPSSWLGSKIADAMKEATPEIGITKETMQFLGGITDKITDQTQNVVDAALQLKSTFESTFTIERFGEVFCNGVLFTAGAVVFTYSMVKLVSGGWSWKFVILAGAAILYLGWTRGIPQKLIQKALKIYNEWKEPKARSQITSDALKKIGKVIASIASAYLVGVTPSSFKLKDFISTVSNLPRFADGAGFTVEMAVKFVEEIVNWIRSFRGLDKMSLIESEFPELNSWIDRVEHVIEEAHYKRFEVNTENADILYNLMMEGNRLIYAGPTLSTNQKAKDAILILQRKLSQIFAAFEQSSIRLNGARMVPLTVLISGPSGVGKSMATFPLLHDVLARVLPASQLKFYEQYPKDFIYSRQAETKYWDGYHGQFAVIFDDFGQARDSVGIPDNEWMDIIRCSNMFPNMCHMADIGSKGNTMFRSSIILATTNLADLAPQSIVEPEAVKRRMKLHFEVYTSPKFAINPNDPAEKRRLDMRKVRAAQKLREEEDPGGECTFIPEVYEFWNRYGTDKANGFVRLSYDEVVDLLVKEYQEHADESERLLRDFEGRRLRAIRERQEKDDPKVVSQMNDGKGKKASIPGLDLSELARRAEKFISSTCSKEDMDLSSKDPIPSAPSSPRRKPSAVNGWSRAQRMHHIWNVYKLGRQGEPLTETDIDAHLRFVSTRIGFDVTDLSDDVPFDPWWSSFREEKVIIDNNTVKVKDFLLDQIAGLHEPNFAKHFLQVLKDVKRDAPEELGSSLRKCCVLYQKVLRPGVVEFSCEDRFYIVRVAKSYVNQLRASVAEWREKHKLVDQICQWLPIVGGILAAAALLGVGAYWYSGQSPQPEGVETMTLEQYTKSLSQGAGESGNPEAKARKRNSRAVRRALRKKMDKIAAQKAQKAGQPKPPMISQGGHDPTAVDTAILVMRTQLFEIWRPGRDARDGFVLFVKGRVALVPYHFVTFYRDLVKRQKVQDDECLILKAAENPKVQHLVRFRDFCNAVTTPTLESCDLCVVRVTNLNFPERKDIVDKFVPTEYIDKDRDYDVLLLCPTKGVPLIHCTTASPMDQYLVNEGSDEETVIREGYEYDISTQIGDCGATLILVDCTTRSKKILGIHTAGSGVGHGFASACSLEALKEAIQLLDQKWPSKVPEIKQPINVSQIDKSDVEAVCDGNFVVLRKLPPAQQVGRAKESKIVPSKLYGAWGEPKTAPAHLVPYERNGVKVDPWKEAFSIYNRLRPVLDFDLAFALANAQMAQIVNALDTPYSKPRLLTWKEAVCGVEGERAYKSVSRKTSAGWPDVLAVKAAGFQYPGKTLWFGRDQEFTLETELALQLEAKVMDLIERANRGERIECVFLDALKDERRKFGRATRPLSGSWQVMLFAFRILFGDFCIMMFKGRMKNGSAIGVNPLGDEWQSLYRWITSTTMDNFLAGDYRNFDSRTLALIALVFVMCVNNWYNDGYSMARFVLMQNITNSFHTDGIYIYEWACGTPSGHPLTAVFNTFAENWQKRFTYYQFGGRSPKAIVEYDMYIRNISLGDDHLTGVGEKAKKILNMFTMVEGCKMTGMEYTNADKTPVDREFMSIKEVTFLKRSFRWEPILHRHVAPLELAVILEMPYWTKRGSSSRSITESNFETAVHYLSMHEPAIFDVHAPKMFREYHNRMGKMFPIVDRESLLLSCSEWDETL